jgi:hypothetical protein
MTIGPGKYDDEATAVMDATSADGVVLIVFNGDRGQGFAVQATLEITRSLPIILRVMADQIEADLYSAIQPKEADH